MLVHLPLVELSRGDILLSPGQENQNIYFLISGRIHIQLERSNAELAFVILPGECIGEMSILEGRPDEAAEAMREHLIKYSARLVELEKKYKERIQL